MGIKERREKEKREERRGNIFRAVRLRAPFKNSLGELSARTPTASGQHTTFNLLHGSNTAHEKTEKPSLGWLVDLATKASTTTLQCHASNSKSTHSDGTCNIN